MKKASQSFVVEFRRKRVLIDPSKLGIDTRQERPKTKERRDVVWQRAESLFSQSPNPIQH